MRVKASETVTVTIPSGFATKVLKSKNAPDGKVNSPVLTETDSAKDLANEALKLAGGSVPNLRRVIQRGLDSVCRTVSAGPTPENLKIAKKLAKFMNITVEAALIRVMAPADEKEKETKK